MPTSSRLEGRVGKAGGFGHWEPSGKVPFVPRHEAAGARALAGQLASEPEDGGM
ncbi:hypothetical protein PoHVEF18_001861 [Penicillium ochrochloron]